MRRFALQATAQREALKESGLRVRLVRHLVDVSRSQSATRYDLAQRLGGTPAQMSCEAQAVLLVHQSHLAQVKPQAFDRTIPADLAAHGSQVYDALRSTSRTNPTGCPTPRVSFRSAPTIDSSSCPSFSIVMDSTNFTVVRLTGGRSLRKTMTYDQGSEMALHERLSADLHMDIFFCDPHSPWQRGSTRTPMGSSASSSPRAWT